MQWNLIFDKEVSRHAKQDTFESVEYVARLCHRLGNFGLNAEQIESPLNLEGIVSNDLKNQKEFLETYAKDTLHIYVTKQKRKKLTKFYEPDGFAAANFSAVFANDKTESGIWQLVIHESGHMLGLVQPGMENYYNSSAGNEGHCAHFSCVMSTRPVEKELRNLRYYHPKDQPEKVFCVDCREYLEGLDSLASLPWYNQR